MLFINSYGAEKKLTSPPHNLSKDEFERLMTEVADIFDGKEWADIVFKLTWVSNLSSKHLFQSHIKKFLPFIIFEYWSFRMSFFSNVKTPTKTEP